MRSSIRKAQPSAASLHVNKPLTNVSIAYVQEQERFIASKVFPIVPVEKQTDVYHKYTKNDWFRDEARERADATESAGSGYTLGTDSYAAKVLAFHKDVGQQARRNADSVFNLDSDATRFVTGRLLLRKEIDWVNTYMKTGVWATDITGVAAAPGAGETVQWDNYADSDPVEDIDDGREKILQTTGFEPNTLVVGFQAWRRLKNHPLFVDRVKHTSSDVLTAAIIAKMLELDRVLVAKAIKATNVEGAAEAYDFIFPKGALLCYTTATPSLLEPTAGYTFAWKGLEGDLGTSIAVSKFEMKKLKADRIEAEAAWVNKLVASDMGYYFDSIVG